MNMVMEKTSEALRNSVALVRRNERPKAVAGIDYIMISMDDLKEED